MAETIGTDAAWGVPITVEVEFDGTVMDWGNRVYKVSNRSNEAQTLDEDIQVSDIQVDLIDIDQAVWGTLGHGTTAFQKTFKVTVWPGGTMTTVPRFDGTRYELLGTNGIGSYVFHTGDVSRIRRKDNLVTITSRNKFSKLKDLKWRFPFSDEASTATIFYVDENDAPNLSGITPRPAQGQYYLFRDSNNRLFGTYRDAVHNLQPDGRFTVFVAAGTQTIGLDGLNYFYPLEAGRTEPGLKPRFDYPGTQFFYDYTILKMQGSVYGSAGTILLWMDGGGTLPDYRKKNLLFQQRLVLENSPGSLFKDILEGGCTFPTFSASDLDTSFLAASETVVWAQGFEVEVPPEGGNVIDTLKNITESVYGVTHITTENKVAFQAYGPKWLNQDVVTFPSSEVISSEYENDVEDFYNRVVVEFAFNHVTGKFTKKVERKYSTWTAQTDRPFEISSKVMQNEEEAYLFAGRVLDRLKLTSPKITLEVPLKHIGIELGTIVSVTDNDSGFSAKKVEVVGYDKDISDSRIVKLTCFDAEPVYKQRGYARFTDDVTVPTTFAFADTAGFADSTGTVDNIDEVTYGTAFVWW